jgi:CDP-4-dehydro-6-deoxyglucose reductase
MVYTVTNRASDNQFQIEPEESVLEAALRHGQLLPYSCRSGSCGSCRGTVVSGDYCGGLGERGVLGDAELSRGERLLCQVTANSDLVIDVAEINAPGAALGLAIRNLPCRVQALERLCHDVMQLTLALPKSQSFRYIAGQYIDILLRDGRRRSFSMANPSSDSPLKLHIRHVPSGAFSSRVFETMKVRELLRLEGPFGTFFLREDSDKRLLFVAGGTGLAPIKAIIEQTIIDGIKRPMHLYWGVRSERDLYDHQWASDIAKAHDHIDYTPVLSEPDASDRPEHSWTGATGWVHQSVLVDHPSLADAEVYAAGPPVMIDAIKQTFFAAGLNEDELFYDSFEHAVA